MTDHYQCTCCPGEGYVLVKIPSGYWQQLQQNAEAWSSLNLKIEEALQRGKEKLAQALEDDEFEYRGDLADAAVRVVENAVEEGTQCGSH